MLPGSSLWEGLELQECGLWALWLRETDLPSINGPGRLLRPPEMEMGSRAVSGGVRWGGRSGTQARTKEGGLDWGFAGASSVS